MKFAILCLCLASTASAAPSIFHYLPHYAGSRPQIPPSQVRNPFPAAQSLTPPGHPGAYSVELIYPHRFAGGAGAQPFGFMKISIPQPPGRSSVEVVLPFDYPPQNIPQQMPNIPTFDASPLPSQDPLQPLQDQPAQTSQMPAKV
ncbi:hypothetical protein ABVT39_024775 [Epinephelus coioides]